MNYEIRDLKTAHEMDALEDIQSKAWGYADREIVPGAMMVVSAHSGGVVAAAFVEHQKNPVGFVYGLPAIRPEHVQSAKPVHHSHMLAIISEHRGTGLARELKLHQRKRVLEMGYELMTWTMDPLVARNARLNLGKLSARAVAYHNDWYSTKDAGLPADRLMLAWSLEHDPTERPLLKATGARALEAVLQSPNLGAMEPRLDLNEDIILIEVPRDIDAIKRNLDAARSWRAAQRTIFTHYFERGYQATNLVADGERLFYRLEQQF